MTPKMTGKRTVRTYVYLYQTARMQLDLSERQVDGSFYSSMSCLVFSAFFVEAYVNHTGASHVPGWPTNREEEQVGDWRAWPKFKKVVFHCQLTSELNKQPYASYRTLLDFRNAIAHARTEVVSYSGEVLPSSKLRANYPELKWESLCNPKATRALFDDATTCVKTLAARLEHGRDPFQSAASGFFGVRPD